MHVLVGSEARSGGRQSNIAPLYKDEHDGCSLLHGRFRNSHLLSQLSHQQQFAWLHRFYLLMDRIAGQHKVYKLHGSPHGFLVSAAVADPDPHHPATLLRFALHLHQAAQKVALPGGQLLDLAMALASGPASSGLLGRLSLTYQVVGHCQDVALELVQTQQEVPLAIAGSTAQLLSPEVLHGLVRLGSVQLRCCPPGEQTAVYSLPRYGGLPLTRLAPAAQTDSNA
ncbi:hypothetical protein ABPG77_010596 [Micractinium sp. CCAP 211/92]